MYFLRKIKYHLLILAIIVSFPSLSQDTSNRDFETWNAIQLNYKHNKEWKFNLQEQFRMKDFSTKMDRIFSQAEVEYKYDKNIDLGFGIRYSGVNDNEGSNKEYEHQIRYHLDATYRYKMEDFEFAYRLRFQSSDQIGKSELEGDYINHNLRGRASAKYNIKNWKLDPFGTFEMFYKRQKGELNGFDRNRITMGSEYKINNKTKLNFLLLREKEYRIWNPKVIYALKLKLIYKIG